MNDKNTVYFTEELIKAYVAKMSNGVEVKIDPDEIGKVYEAIKSNNFARVKQGIINPSFLVAIIYDEERIRRVMEIEAEIINHNRMADQGVYGYKKEFKGMQSLKDIFADMPQMKKIGMENTKLQISNKS